MVPLISVKRADPGARFCPQQSLAGLTVTTHCVQCSGARFCPQQSLNDSLQLLTACNAPSKEKRIQEPWFSFPHLFVSRFKTSVVKSGGNQKGEGGLSGRFYEPKDYVNEISNTIPLTDCYFCLKELQNWIKNRLFWFFPPDEITFKCDLSDDQSSLRRFFLLSPQVHICWGVLPAGSYLLGVCGKKGLL